MVAVSSYGGTMGKYRLYPQKSNTLIEGSEINTGENEVMELWYGSEGVTKHLVQFDFSGYEEKYEQGLVPHITAATSVFHMTNCYPFLEKEPYFTSSIAASSIVVVKVVQQAWDSGIGHDFYGLETENGYSNWYCATTIANWAAGGGDYLYTIFSGAIDKGYENFSGTILDEIHLWETFTGSNHGLAIMFHEDYEALTGENQHILKFYTDNARTKYKMPYIEFNWDNQVTDQRNEVYAGSTKRLYLYLKRNGTFTDAYSISGVSIEYSDTGLTPFTTTSINNPMPGIYFVDFICDTGATVDTIYTDAWAVKYESGSSYVDISQSGSVIDAISVWDSSDSDVVNSSTYTLTIPHLKSRYTRGDYLFVQVNALTNYTSTNNILKNMEYKLNLIDGNLDVPFTDWEPVSYSTSENFIMLDTDWLFSGYSYSLDFRYTIDGTLIHDHVKRKFWLD